MTKSMQEEIERIRGLRQSYRELAVKRWEALELYRVVTEGFYDRISRVGVAADAIITEIDGIDDACLALGATDAGLSSSKDLRRRIRVANSALRAALAAQPDILAWYEADVATVMSELKSIDQCLENRRGDIEQSVEAWTSHQVEALKLADQQALAAAVAKSGLLGTLRQIRDLVESIDGEMWALCNDAPSRRSFDRISYLLIWGDEVIASLPALVRPVTIPDEEEAIERFMAEMRRFVAGLHVFYETVVIPRFFPAERGGDGRYQMIATEGAKPSPVEDVFGILGDYLSVPPTVEPDEQMMEWNVPVGVEIVAFDRQDIQGKLECMMSGQGGCGGMIDRELDGAMSWLSGKSETQTLLDEIAKQKSEMRHIDKPIEARSQQLSQLHDGLGHHAYQVSSGMNSSFSTKPPAPMDDAFLLEMTDLVLSMIPIVGTGYGLANLLSAIIVRKTLLTGSPVQSWGDWAEAILGVVPAGVAFDKVKKLVLGCKWLLESGSMSGKTFGLLLAVFNEGNVARRALEGFLANARAFSTSPKSIEEQAVFIGRIVQQFNEIPKSVLETYLFPKAVGLGIRFADVTIEWMGGDPSAAEGHKQEDYAVVRRGEVAYDIVGNPVSPESPLACIPLRVFHPGAVLMALPPR